MVKRQPSGVTPLLPPWILGGICIVGHILLLDTFLITLSWASSAFLVLLSRFLRLSFFLDVDIHTRCFSSALFVLYSLPRYYDVCLWLKLHLFNDQSESPSLPQASIHILPNFQKFCECFLKISHPTLSRMWWPLSLCSCVGLLKEKCISVIPAGLDKSLVDEHKDLLCCL